ncbi:MAG: SDR family NAD(P)-dependent oxidoreductase [Actinobacteria bacterium]|nr:SDR family NAD(P)-dependent oxidoreductase [Actinomycetota bacterium]
MEDLEGKVAVVTGAASGIGWALARRFGAEGMKVVLADVEEDALGSRVAELGDTTDVTSMVCDVSRLDDVLALRDHANETFGAVHVVCNNAGVGGGGPMESLTENDWSWVLGVNLWGVIHGVQAFLPGLLAQGEGHVVNTASVAGLFSAPFMGPYNVSKFGVVTLSETLYNELAMSGSDVGVSVLCPSWVATNIAASARNRPESLLNEVAEGEVAETPDDPSRGMAEMLGQFITDRGMAPEDVAAKVVDAVRTKRFYILTHDDSAPAVRLRMEAILNGQPPPFLVPQ